VFHALTTRSDIAGIARSTMGRRAGWNVAPGSVKLESVGKSTGKRPRPCLTGVRSEQKGAVQAEALATHPLRPHVSKRKTCASR